MKCIYQTLPAANGACVKVYSPNEFGEYVVKPQAHGRTLPESTHYYTNDRDDAIHTADTMASKS